MSRREFFTQTRAEPFALTISTAVFAALVIVLSPALSDAGWLPRIFAALLGAVSLSALFLTARWLLHLQWARPLLGVWVYRTIPHDESKRSQTGYGVAEFSLRHDGQLGYRVDLFRALEDAVAAATGCSADTESHGTAVGLAQAFDEQSGALWILYQVQYYNDTEPNREGHLFVRAAGPTGHKMLRGSWASDLNGRELSAGVMTMMRPEDFGSLAEGGRSDE